MLEMPLKRGNLGLGCPLLSATLRSHGKAALDCSQSFGTGGPNGVDVKLVDRAGRRPLPKRRLSGAVEDLRLCDLRVPEPKGIRQHRADPYGQSPVVLLDRLERRQ